MPNHAENQLSAQFRLKSAGQGIFRRIHAYRDSGTHADEWLILFKILLPMSALFTLSFGAALHYNLTLPYLGNAGAWVFALLFTAFLEVAKTIAGIWFFRNLIFGLWRQGLASLGMMVCGGIIALGAFWWSFYNSTHGIAYLTKFLAPTAIERQKVDVAASTADVDARLDQTTQIAQNGLQSKWRGNTTVEGLRIARNATKVQIEQEKQRTLLLQQAASEQIRADEHRDAFVDRVSVLLSMLGGKMEWFQLFLMFGIVLCEHSLWARMHQQAQQPAAAPRTNGAAAHTPTPPPPPTNAHFFNRSRENGQVAGKSPTNPDPQTVPRSPQTVPRSDADAVSTDPDAVLKLAKKDLQSRVANFSDGQRRTATTANGVFNIINEVGHKMRGRGFTPSQAVALDFYEYMDTVFEALQTNGHPYEYRKAFMSDLGCCINIQAA